MGCRYHHWVSIYMYGASIRIMIYILYVPYASPTSDSLPPLLSSEVYRIYGFYQILIVYRRTCASKYLPFAIKAHYGSPVMQRNSE